VSYVKKEHRCKILESPTNFTWAYCTFCALGDLISLTLLSTGHGSDTTCNDLGHYFKRLAFEIELHKFLHIKTTLISNRCGTICSTSNSTPQVINDKGNEVKPSHIPVTTTSNYPPKIELVISIILLMSSPRYP